MSQLKRYCNRSYNCSSNSCPSNLVTSCKQAGKYAQNSHAGNIYLPQANDYENRILWTHSSFSLTFYGHISSLIVVSFPQNIPMSLNCLWHVNLEINSSQIKTSISLIKLINDFKEHFHWNTGNRNYFVWLRSSNWLTYCGNVTCLKIDEIIFGCF